MDRQHRRLSCRARDYDAVSALADVKIEQPIPCRPIQRPIGGHRSNNSNQASAKTFKELREEIIATLSGGHTPWQAPIR